VGGGGGNFEEFAKEPKFRQVEICKWEKEYGDKEPVN